MEPEPNPHVDLNNARTESFGTALARTHASHPPYPMIPSPRILSGKDDTRRLDWLEEVGAQFYIRRESSWTRGGPLTRAEIDRVRQEES